MTLRIMRLEERIVMDGAAAAAVAVATATVAVAQPEAKTTSSTDTSATESKTTSAPATTDSSHADTATSTTTSDAKTTSDAGTTTTGTSGSQTSTTTTAGATTTASTTDASKTTDTAGATGATSDASKTTDPTAATGTATDATGSTTTSALGTATSDPTASGATTLGTAGTTSVTAGLGVVDTLGVTTVSSTADLTTSLGGSTTTSEASTTVEGPHVLAIASTVNDAKDLAAAAGSNVITTIYDAEHDTLDQVLEQIHAVLGEVKAASIALATKGDSAGDVFLTQNQTVTADNLLSQAEVSHFFEALGSMIADGGRLDLLSCDITASDQGIKLVSELEQVTHHEVAASNDRTGNAEAGGDWQLETGNVDAKAVYFDAAKLADYHGVLDNARFDTAPSAATATEQTSKALGTVAVNDDTLGPGGLDWWDGATMTIERTGGGGPSVEDTFNVVGAALQAGSFNNGNGDLRLVSDGSKIGTATYAGGTLTLTFSDTFGSPGLDTATINQVLSDLSYRNGSDAPPASVALRWTLNDGTLGAGNTTFSDQNITIDAVNDAPVLAGDGAFAGITENDTNGAGQTVAAIVNSAANIGDVDSGAVKGIAVYGTLLAGNGTGHFDYSTDGGTNWTNMGVVNFNSALLLRDTDMVRWQPDTQNGSTGTMQYYAWDQTGGTAGGEGSKIDVLGIGTGGDKPFSTATAQAVITASDVNDAPTLTVDGAFTGITEDQTNSAGQTVAAFANSLGQLGDVDSGASKGIAVYSATVTGGPGGGAWQYSTDGGTNWSTVVGAAANNALLLRDTDLVRFNPDGDNASAARLQYYAWDQTGATAGQQGTYFNVTGTGTGTDKPFSAGTAKADITVSAVNDAPTLTGNGAFTGLTEKDTGNAGELVSAFANTAARIGDVDSGAVKGIAIYSATVAGSGSGVWEYSTNGGGTWSAVVGAAANNALLLRDNDLVRFNPDGANGNTGSLLYRAWDQTGATAGQQGTYADVTGTGTGADKPFSSATAQSDITVTSVNDAPVMTTDRSLTVFTDSAAAVAGKAIKANDMLNLAADIHGVAVTTTTGTGVWQYSHDGNTWVNFGTVDADHALMLLADDQVRFIPDARAAASGTFTYRTWVLGTDLTEYSHADPTGAAMGAQHNPNLGALDNAAFDATANGAAGQMLGDFLRDGTGASLITIGGQQVGGVAITDTLGTGEWQYSRDGKNWLDFGTLTGTSVLFLESSDFVRIKPGSTSANSNLTFQAWDNNVANAFNANFEHVDSDGGANPAPANLSATGGGSGPLTFSSAATLDGVAVSILATDRADNNGAVQNGVAIQWASTDNGVWQYKSGANWVDFGSVTTTNALLLNAATSVRFVPNSNQFVQTGVDGGGNPVYSTTQVTYQRGTFTYSAWNTTQGGAEGEYHNLETDAALTRAHYLDSVTEKQTSDADMELTVGSLVGQVVRVNADLSLTPVDGVAIYTSTGAGWEYKTNDIGSVWTPFPVLGGDGTGSLLLKTTDLIKYTGVGTGTFDYYSWDATVDSKLTGNTSDASDAKRGTDKAYGLAGDHVSLTVSANNGQTVSDILRDNGGGSSVTGKDWQDVDSGTASMGIVITSLNIANPYNGTNGDSTVIDLSTNFEGNPYSTFTFNTGTAGTDDTISNHLGTPNVLDRDGSAVQKIAITYLDTSNGTWKYSEDGGAIWNNFDPLAPGKNAWVLNTSAKVQFKPDAVALGHTTDGSFIYSAYNGTESNGETVYSYIAGPKTMPTTYNGRWQYSTNGGANWTDVSTDALDPTNKIAIHVSDSNALVLAPTDLVRFIPDGHNGTVATMQYHLWDQSDSVANGGTVNAGDRINLAVTGKGGITAYSNQAGAASIVVTNVNDAPLKTIMVAPRAPVGDAIYSAFTIDMDIADNPESRLNYRVMDKASAGYPALATESYKFVGNQFQASGALPANTEWHYQVGVRDLGPGGTAYDQSSSPAGGLRVASSVNSPNDASANGYHITRTGGGGDPDPPFPTPIVHAAAGHGETNDGTTPGDTNNPGGGTNTGFAGDAGGPGGLTSTPYTSSFGSQDSSSWFDSSSKNYLNWDSGNRYGGDDFTRGNFDLGTLGGAAADVLNRLQALAMGGALADIFGGGDRSPAEAVQAAKQVLNDAIETMDFGGPVKSVLHGTNDMILDLVLLPPSQDALNEAQLCVSSLSAIVSTVFGSDSSPLAQRMVTVWVNILNKVLQDLAANGFDTSQVQQQLNQIKQSMGQ
ncbi:MAG: DUF4347 domain-containing protein [Pseudomonadota bacterium]